MSKYWLLFKQQLEYMLAYRATGLIWFLADTTSHLVFILFWLAAFQGKSAIAGFSLREMILYYLGAMFVSAIITPHPQHWLADTIKNGQFSAYFLLRPLSVLGDRLVSQIAWRLFRFVIMIPTLLLLWLFLSGFISGFSVSGQQLLWLSLSLALAFLGQMLLKTCLGLAAIWFEEIGWLTAFWDLLMALLGGWFFPITLLPQAMQVASLWLPFRYWFYFPLSIFLGKLSSAEVFQGLIIQLFWLVVAVLIYRVVLKRGIRAYSAYGG